MLPSWPLLHLRVGLLFLPEPNSNQRKSARVGGGRSGPGKEPGNRSYGHGLTSFQSHRSNQLGRTCFAKRKNNGDSRKPLVGEWWLPWLPTQTLDRGLNNSPCPIAGREPGSPYLFWWMRKLWENWPRSIDPSTLPACIRWPARCNTSSPLELSGFFKARLG